MKSYEDMAQNALGRIEEIKVQQKKRRALAVKIGAPAASLCLLLALTLTLGPSLADKKAAPMQTDDESVQEMVKEKSITDGYELYEKESTDGTIGYTAFETQTADNDVCHALKSIVEWNGKTVEIELSHKLNLKTDEKIEICASPYINWDYEYNGKPLSEYHKLSADNNVIAEKYAQLLKEGDYLKYGEKLCTEGADGVVWSRFLYDERMEFYGEDFLSRYIVNGEFLREKLEKDREEYMKNDYYMQYAAAYESYIKKVAKDVGGKLFNNGLSSKIELYLTAAELKSFNPNHIEAWTFMLKETASYPALVDDCVSKPEYETK